MSYEWIGGRLAGGPGNDERPTRLANTITAVAGRPGRLLVVNPHPETWNNWQLPYASFSTDLPKPVASDSFESLETALRGEIDLSSPEARAVAQGEMASTLAIAVKLSEAAVAETYALRFSKTANVWTAYRFVYVAATLESEPRDVEFALFDLSGEDASLAIADGVWRDLALSENLLMVLRDDLLRAAIEGALDEHAASAS